MMLLPLASTAGRSFWFTIDGSPPSKNDRRIVQFGAKLALAKGERTKSWESAAFIQLGEQMRALRLRPLRGDVRLSGVVYWKTRNSDMAIEMIQDVLQGKLIRGKLGRGRKHAGLVYLDDAQVMEYGRWFRRFDSTRPRVELLVEEIGAAQEKLL